MNDSDWLDDFRDPPAAYRPVPFWSWNGAMDPAEVRRQIGVIADAGWGGGFIHSRVGLTTDYLGDKWFAAVDAAVDECRGRGLPVWLYDEDRWPSGFSGGTVTREHPEHRSCYVAALAPGAAVPADAEVVAEHDGLRVIVGREPMGNELFNGATYLDPLSPAAVGKFLADAYAVYHDRYGDDYGTTVQAEFTDEPAPLSLHSRLPLGAMPYTADLPEQYERCHGEPLVPRLHLLFAEGQGAAAFRLCYYRLVSDLFEERFTKRIGQWCGGRGIALTGHFMNEHNLRDAQRLGYRPAANYPHQQIPGVDHLGRQIFEVFGAKQCSSAAHQAGRPRVLSELFGVSGQNLSFEDRRWVALQQIVLGVNLLVPHLSLYTMAGVRKRDYPPNLFYQQPWWPLNRACDDPLSRLCGALGRGRFVADAAVLHPQESAAAAWRAGVSPDGQCGNLFRDRGDLHADAKAVVDRLVAALDKLLKRLLGGQIGFDLVDEAALAGATVEDGPRLCVGEMAYPAIVLPELLTLRATTFDQLRAFAEAGGTVFRDFDDAADVLLDGEPDERLAAWLRALPRAAALRERLAPAVVVRDGAADAANFCWVHARDLDDGDRLILAVNLHRTAAVTGTLRADGGWRSAAALDTTTGDERPAVLSDDDDLPLDLPPAGHALWRLSRQSAARPPASAMTPDSARAVPLEPTSVDALDPNALPLDHAQVRLDGEFTPHAVPVLAVKAQLDAENYRGPLTLRHPFEVGPGAVPDAAWLIVEDADTLRVSVNGEPVPTNGGERWLDPRWHRLDIGGLLRPGANVVETHVDDFVPGDPSAVENARRYGTEPETIYLLGDFGVGVELSPGRTAGRWDDLGLPPVVTHEAARQRIVARPTLRGGDVVPQNLPFYAGRLRLRFDLDADTLDLRTYFFEAEHCDAAVAEVRLDGEPVGHFVTRPWRVALPPLTGRHVLELTLFGTLRNLLGPHHNPAGEMPFVGPPAFLPELPEAELGPALADWIGRGEVPGGWRPGYSLVSFGRTGRFSLIPARTPS